MIESTKAWTVCSSSSSPLVRAQSIAKGERVSATCRDFPGTCEIG